MKSKLLWSFMASFLLFQGIGHAAQYDQYTVSEGDTAWSISQQAEVKLSDLLRINPLVDTKNLYPGLIISLPDGHKQMTGSFLPAGEFSRKTYTVQDKDTFWAISQKLHVNFQYLIQANPQVTNIDKIESGMILNVPAAPITVNKDASWDVKADAIIALAKDQLGVPYVWGGATPWVSLDCSGLTQYVFSKIGIEIPHQAMVQFNYGTPVSKENLRKGDLVFFKEHGSATITHVGIYLGNDQMINADTDPKDGVQITNLFGDAYYNSYYVGAKRLIE